MTREQLSGFKNISIKDLKREELSNADDIVLDESLCVDERVHSFLEQTKNPFAYNVGKYILQVDSMEGATETVEECMEVLVRKNLEL